VDGRPVGAADGAVVGAAVMVEMIEALTDDAPKLRSTANNVDEETLTPKRGEEDPPTLTPSKGAVPDVVAAALLALEVTTALLALETMAELLAFEMAAALLVFEVTTAAALLDLTTAAALLVLTTLLIFAVVVTARASTCSRIGAAATKALKNVIVVRSFIVTDVLDRAEMRSDRGAREMPRRTRDRERK
jgi:hypothetical protein